MKTLRFLPVLALVLAFLSGCVFTPSTTTQPTTTQSTADPRNVVLDAAFLRLEPSIPAAIVANVVLPASDEEGVEITYVWNDVALTDNTLVYTKLADDLTTTLSVTLTYQGYSQTRAYTIIVLRDQELYEAAHVDEIVAGIEDSIQAALPETIGSDFTLPDVSYPGATISYATDVSRIFNNRFIFTFPVTEETFHITATITYRDVTESVVYPIVMKGLNELHQIPTIYIQTDNDQDITSETDYITGVFSLVTYDDNQNETVLLANAPMQIRGRGNSTWYMPKKSYRIKFGDKTNLLFDYSEDDWVLLANFADQTLIRNGLAYNFARSLDMEFTPSVAFVDVFLNNEYLGNYMLTDQVEVDNNRVDIEEHSTDTDTGYLVEMDKRLLDWPSGVEGVDYFMIDGVPYVIKSPKTDSIYYTSAQFNYIEDYIYRVNYCLKNQQDYSDLIDIDSFVDWFIVEELFKNVDSGYSSVFMYKDKGGLLKMGPVWDFDLSTSNPGHLQQDLRQPLGWYTSLEYKNIWYYYLMKYPSFQQALKTRWNEIYDHQVQDLLNSVYPMADSIAKSRYLNFQTWNVIGSWYDWYTSTEVYNAKTYEEQVYIVYHYLEVRSVWMNNAINQF